MAKCSLPLFPIVLALVSLLVIAYSAAPVAGVGWLGGRKKIEGVEKDKEVQELGEYAVEEYNRRRRGDGYLEFRQVVEAEKQVVSGVKYYLKIEAADLGGLPEKFQAEVVVQPSSESKQLLNFGPSLSLISE